MPWQWVSYALRSSDTSFPYKDEIEDCRDKNDVLQALDGLHTLSAKARLRGLLIELCP